MKTLRRLLPAAFLSAAASSGPALAEPPAVLPLTGFLTDAGGLPIDGPTALRLSLYPAQAATQPLFAEEQEVDVDSGHLVAYVGAAEPLDPALVSGAADLWLGIAVEDDPEMQRIRLGSVPYALLAHTVAEVPPHLHAAADLDGVALAGKSCQPGQVVTGFDAKGFPVCGLPQAPSGGGFAKAGQSCPPGLYMTGIDPDGGLLCAPVPNTVYTGSDFALSGQSCGGDQVVVGISSFGGLLCGAGGGAGGLTGSGQSNRLAKWKSADELEESIVTESFGKIGINKSSPSKTLDIQGDVHIDGQLIVDDEILWGGSKFTSSSCLVVGGSSCGSACSAHGMSCSKALSIDDPGQSTSCSQSGFKLCCCTD